MDERLIRERYKVVRVLIDEPEYAAVEAVDIQDRERPDRLLNLYEGEALRRCSRMYAGLKSEDCPAFRRVFLDGQNKTLAAVFEDVQELPLSKAMQAKKPEREDRLLWAEGILHAALTLNNLPDGLAWAALRPDNLFLRDDGKTVALRFVVPPPPTERETPARAAAERVLAVYPRRLCRTYAEAYFLDRLADSDFASTVDLYAFWRRAKAEIDAEAEEAAKLGLIRRLIRRVRIYFYAMTGEMR